LFPRSLNPVPTYATFGNVMTSKDGTFKASDAPDAGLKVKFGHCRSRIEEGTFHASARPMAIVIDPSIAKDQGHRQPSPPPPQPPPSYAESALTHPLVVQPGISSVPHAHGYGPTPIGQQQSTLPYYDPRSVHSVQAAKRRAKERFVGAVLWVLAISALLSVLVWMNVRIQLGWLVSHWALLRTEPDRTPLSSQTLPIVLVR